MGREEVGRGASVRRRGHDRGVAPLTRRTILGAVGAAAIVGGTPAPARADDGTAAVDVRAFGAAGDGERDDTAAVVAALQAALDRSEAANRDRPMAERRPAAVVVLPAGTYRCPGLADAQLRVLWPIALRGDGAARLELPVPSGDAGPDDDPVLRVAAALDVGGLTMVGGGRWFDLSDPHPDEPDGELAWSASRGAPSSGAGRPCGRRPPRTPWRGSSSTRTWWWAREVGAAAPAVSSSPPTASARPPSPATGWRRCCSTGSESVPTSSPVTPSPTTRSSTWCARATRSPASGRTGVRAASRPTASGCRRAAPWSAGTWSPTWPTATTARWRGSTRRAAPW